MGIEKVPVPKTVTPAMAKGFWIHSFENQRNRSSPIEESSFTSVLFKCGWVHNKGILDAITRSLHYCHFKTSTMRGGHIATYIKKEKTYGYWRVDESCTSN